MKNEFDPLSIVGTTRGNFEVLSYLKYRNSSHYYKVKCKCGHIKVITLQSLKTTKKYCTECYKAVRAKMNCMFLRSLGLDTRKFEYPQLKKRVRRPFKEIYSTV